MTCDWGTFAEGAAAQLEEVIYETLDRQASESRREQRLYSTLEEISAELRGKPSVSPLLPSCSDLPTFLHNSNHKATSFSGQFVSGETGGVAGWGWGWG